MSFIPQSITRQVFRSGLVLQKHAPTILFVGGVAGIVTSTVLACKATLKLSESLPEMKEELEDVKNAEFVEQEKRFETLAYVYGKNTAHIARLYGPAIVVGGVSICALTGSHVVLTKRNAGLTAAYAAVSKAYDEYRGRVQEALGEEKEKDIYHAVRVEKELDGDPKVKNAKVADPTKWSPYARFFDEQSTAWQKTAEMNKLFVQCQQNYANHLLQARGHVFLNDVYDMLGLSRTTAGAVVGWIYGGDGDNYIDFGMFEAYNDRFMKGWERSAILDFNVDGVIYDNI